MRAPPNGPLRGTLPTAVRGAVERIRDDVASVVIDDGNIVAVQPFTHPRLKLFDPQGVLVTFILDELRVETRKNWQVNVPCELPSQRHDDMRPIDESVTA